MKSVTPALKEKILWVQCDNCGVTHYNNPSGIYEIQEFLSFSDTAGYGNRVVGDMTKWSIDLCQDCWYDLLGPYIQKEKPQ